MKGRFAPSPTGRMHLGNVFSALLSWLSVKAAGGEWLLRIEDLDPQRSRREYADLLMQDLEWLGLPWDGEPVWQSRRGDIYQHYFEQLAGRRLVYPCRCTRADLLATQAPHESDGRVVYPGNCRPRSREEWEATASAAAAGGAAMRLLVNDEDIGFSDGHYGPQSINMARHVGDFIVRRKDGAWAYQLAVVVDDALTGVDQVVRGRDLLLSSPQQIYVARLLGFAEPRFAHLPLLLNRQGQRLSKRDRSMDMEALRRRFQPRELVGLLAYRAGLLTEPQPVSPEQLVAGFSWSRVPLGDIVVGDSPC